MKWLEQCTVAQLQSIARAIGSNTGGKKAILRANLQADLQRDRFALHGPDKASRRDQHKILSIDMGIRNLAMCTVVVPKDSGSRKTPVLPVVQDWARIAISKKAKPDSSGNDGMGVVAKESFDPPTYAQHAYDLVSKYILPSQPTQVLIERQRFRSMGGSAVQEWTLRVNMFEAMIYATLKTFSEQKLWHGSVHPVAPTKVSRFWLEDEDGRSVKISSSKRSSASSKTKAAKIALVDDWLSSGQYIELKGEAANVARAYRERLAGRKASKASVEQDGLGAQEREPYETGKLDDLADCLLQAMAWLQWNKNRIAFESGERRPEGISIFQSRKAPAFRKPRKTAVKDDAP